MLLGLSESVLGSSSRPATSRVPVPASLSSFVRFPATTVVAGDARRSGSNGPDAREDPSALNVDSIVFGEALASVNGDDRSAFRFISGSDVADNGRSCLRALYGDGISDGVLVSSFSPVPLLAE